MTRFALLPALLGLTAAVAIAAPRKVLIEVFTNSHCGPCASMHAAVANHITGKPREAGVTFIYYHVATYQDDPIYQANKAEPLARKDFYGNVYGTPTVFFDGEIQNGSYSGWPALLDERIAQSSPIALGVSGGRNGKELSVNLSVVREGSVPASLRYYLAVVENIDYTGRNNVPRHDYALRKALTAARGDDFAFGGDGTASLSKQITLKDEWIEGNIGIVAFVQDAGTGEILQSTYTSLADLSGTALPAPPTPTFPDDQATQTPTDGEIRWTAADGVTFQAQIADGVDFATVVLDVDDLTEPKMTYADLMEGATYYWRVRARNQAGAGGWSAVRAFTTAGAAQAPGVPTPTAPINNAVDQPTQGSLLWSTVPGADGYRVQISTDENFMEPIVDRDNLSEPLFSYDGLAAGTTYFWRTQARNTVGAGEWSQVWRFSTEAASDVEDRIALADGVTLSRNVPNPFFSQTMVECSLPRPGHARLVLLDATGREAATIFEGTLDRGPHSFMLDADNVGGGRLPAGIYFYRLQTERTALTMRCVLLR